MPEEREAETTMLAVYSEVRYSVGQTGPTGVPPVRLSTCNGAFHFQDYLSGDEARELARALIAMADAVDPVDALDFYAATDTTIEQAAAMVAAEVECLSGKRGRPLGGWRNVAVTTVAGRLSVNPYTLDHLLRAFDAKPEPASVLCDPPTPAELKSVFGGFYAGPKTEGK